MKYEFEQEYKKIGLKIAYYRKLAGLTQEMLAERLDVATSYIGQIEAAGMYKPISLTTLLRIAKALDTPACKFLEFYGLYNCQKSKHGGILNRHMIY